MKYIVIDVLNQTGEQIEFKMNELDKQGYKRVFQSDLEWYQGRGMSGIICFELQEE
jgi:hypothetical protein